jgi:hypothetical protein
MQRTLSGHIHNQFFTKNFCYYFLLLLNFLYFKHYFFNISGLTAQRQNTFSIHILIFK